MNWSPQVDSFQRASTGRRTAACRLAYHIKCHARSKNGSPVLRMLHDGQQICVWRHGRYRMPRRKIANTVKAQRLAPNRDVVNPAGVEIRGIGAVATEPRCLTGAHIAGESGSGGAVMAHVGVHQLAVQVNARFANGGAGITVILTHDMHPFTQLQLRRRDARAGGLSIRKRDLETKFAVHFVEIENIFIADGVINGAKVCGDISGHLFQFDPE